MFQHLYFGDLGANVTLSSSVIELAKQDGLSNLKKRLELDLRAKLKCCQSGKTKIPEWDPSFTLPEHHIIDNANMGNWQVKMLADCDWRCGPTKNADNCSCDCTANCKLNVFISKTYTFKPAGFNSQNNSRGGRAFYYPSWFAQSMLRWNWEPAYFVSAKFTDTYSSKLKPACGK